MADERKTIERFIGELGKLRQRVNELEAIESERKHTEALLRKSEEKYRTLTEDLNVGIYRSSPEGKFIEVNPALYKMFGYKSKTEFLKINVSDLYQKPEDMISFNKKLLKEGFVKNEELQLKRKDGTLFISSATTAAIKNERGKVLYYDGIMGDVTERKKAENIQNVLHNILEATTKTEALGNLLERIHAEVNTLMDAKNFFVGLYDEESNTYTFPYYVDKGNKFDTHKPLKLSRSITDYVRKSGEPLLVNKPLFEDFQKRKNLDLVGSPAESWMGVPLMSDNKVSGVLVVQSYTNPEAYSQDDLVILTFVSGHIAMAIERKSAEEAIKKSEEKYRTLTENLNVGVYRSTSGLKGKYIEVNSAMAKMFGYDSKKEFLKITPSDIYQAPEERARFSEKMLREGFVKNEELQLKRKDGTPIICSTTALAVKDQNGKVICYDGIIEDITESKRAEEELKKSKELYSSIMESINEGIVVFDRDFHYKYWNRTMENISGIPRSELIESGKRPWDVFPHLIEQGVDKMMKQAMDGEVVGREEIPFRLPDGTTRFTSEVFLPLRTTTGEINGIIGVIRDITERKQMEQMLIQSEKMASIGTIAAGIVHEINNPLGYISSNLRTLEKYDEKFTNFCRNIDSLLEEVSQSGSDEISNIKDNYITYKEENNIDYLISDMKEAISESLEGVEKVKKIVIDLKDFSRSEKPEMKLADINDGIEKTLNIIWNELKYKSEINREFGDIPKIECDIQKLNQVFMNLLINAVQAIENRGVIKIKTFRSHNFVVIQISDTGKGIPKENQSKIFDAFFTTKESGKGTGLGLSISLKIIQEHNGTIDVESKSGEGTTFTIRLPLKKLVQIIEHKVLIVDDEEDFRDVLKKSIQLYDPSFTVKTAKDGFEAGELINSLKPNLVILDIKMPGLNGFEVCRKIMSSELKDKAKVIMITGFEDIDAKEKSIKAGAFEFMKKPINIKKLYNVLDKIFK